MTQDLIEGPFFATDKEVRSSDGTVVAWGHDTCVAQVVASLLNRAEEEGLIGANLGRWPVTGSGNSTQGGKLHLDGQ